MEIWSLNTTRAAAVAVMAIASDPCPEQLELGQQRRQCLRNQHGGDGEACHRSDSSQGLQVVGDPHDALGNRCGDARRLVQTADEHRPGVHQDLDSLGNGRHGLGEPLVQRLPCLVERFDDRLACDLTLRAQLAQLANGNTHAVSDDLGHLARVLQDGVELIAAQRPASDRLAELADTGFSLLGSGTAKRDGLVEALGELQYIALREAQGFRLARDLYVYLRRSLQRTTRPLGDTEQLIGYNGQLLRARGHQAQLVLHRGECIRRLEDATDGRS
jgi:hypothetical protein